MNQGVNLKEQSTCTSVTDEQERLQDEPKGQQTQAGHFVNGTNQSPEGKEEEGISTKRAASSMEEALRMADQIPAHVRARAGHVYDKFVRAYKGCLPGLQSKRGLLKERLEERLWAAAWWRDYQLECVQRTYETEVQQIERDHEAERMQLKESLVAELLEKKRRLLESKDRLEGNDGINTMLGEQDIYDDLRQIYRSEQSGRRSTARLAASATNYRASEEEEGATPHSTHNTKDVYISQDVLHYFGRSFLRGDAVVVGTSEGEQLGTLFALGTRDVWIRVNDGSKMKVTFQQMRSGRYSLSKTDSPS